jgi:tRNA A-37 threonylcarbamoyl transferase component Bud32
MTANASGNGSHACPDREELRALHAGRLPPPRLEAVAAHLNLCPSCSSVMDELHDSTQPPLPGLAGTHLRRPLSEAERRRAVAIAEEAGGLPAAAADAVPVEQLPLGGSPCGELGQYQLLEALGAGGMGQVFKARHPLMDRTVALKVLHPRYLRHPAAVRRFRQEIRVLARLDHPNIVRAYDAYQARDLHVLVMEYVNGTDLARLVKERGPLPAADACDYVRQAALGLQHAHEHGLVHRDLKPSNLIVTGGGRSDPLHPPRVKVLDLGLALIREEQPAAGGPAPAGPVVGTLDFMAPEQWQDPQAVDIRADIYSLGCTLYHLLTGHPPFRTPGQDDPVAKMKAHAEAPVPPIQAERPDLPDALAAVLQRLLAKDPGQRYATPAAVAEALAPFAGRGGRRRAGRRRPWAAVGILLACVAGGLMSWHAINRPSGAQPAASRPRAVDGPPAAVPLRVVSFRVSRHRGDPAQALGDIGIGLCLSARDDDDARVHAELSEPAHCLLIAFNPNGRVELCLPRNPAAPLPRTAAIHYPPERVPPARQRYFALNNGAGLQAFALLAFREPPPSYRQWQARVGAAPWRHEEAEGVWSFDGGRLQLLGVGRDERERDGPPAALEQLCEFLRRHAESDALQVLAFPVKE